MPVDSLLSDVKWDRIVCDQQVHTVTVLV